MTIPVTLHSDNFQAEVDVFNVEQMLMSLFDNKELNQDQNMVVNSDNYFSKNNPPDNWYGEINSGSWYTAAYNNLSMIQKIVFMSHCTFQRQNYIVRYG